MDMEIVLKFSCQDKIDIGVSACATPSCNGVYALFDKNSNCLHIGRATNLRLRISRWKSPSSYLLDKICYYSFLVIKGEIREEISAEFELLLLKLLKPKYGKRGKCGNYSFSYGRDTSNWEPEI